MIGALKKFFSGSNANNGNRESKNLAKSRLSFVLVQDRTGLTQDEIANFKREMVAVIERYFVIDETGLDVSYKRETDSTMLIINSPVVVKRQDGFKHRVGSKHKSEAEVKVEAKSEDTTASAPAENPITQTTSPSAPMEAEKRAVGSN